VVGGARAHGWVVIGLIALLGFVSGEVAVSKALMLRRVGQANDRFLKDFRAQGRDFLSLAPVAAASGAASSPAESGPLFVMFTAGADELGRLRQAQGANQQFNSLSLDVVRASVDTSLATEANRINAKMVLLTLAVSGAPFLGLLGTVVGIMITFATIALKGDVNINTIAPGIAGALTATVSGMAVAIPALFGYNVLMIRIKEVTSVMEAFRDELLSKIAASLA
jgi:biopolymer transport protein ExbB